MHLPVYYNYLHILNNSFQIKTTDLTLMENIKKLLQPDMVSSNL